MRLIISREAPTREAISLWVSGSRMDELAVLLLGELQQQARDAAVDVHQREAAHVVGQIAHPVGELPHHVQGEAGIALDDRGQLGAADEARSGIPRSPSPRPSAARRPW
jgi:hypothetical protein